MKKSIVTMVCMLAMSSAFAQTTKHKMIVVDKDGIETTYRVKDVERVKFTDVTYDLENQWALNDNTSAVGNVEMIEEDNAYTFYVYDATLATTDNEANNNDNKALMVSVPKSLMGTTIDLASHSDIDLEVYDAEDRIYNKGTLLVKFDKFQKNVTISLDAESDDNDLLCEYSGTFNKTFLASNVINMGATDGQHTPYNITAAFTVKPESVGGATSFAFGDVETTEPSGMLNGNVGVWVSVSAAKLNNGTIDMTTDADSYSFRYIDYASRNVYEKVTSGTITTGVGYDGRQYVAVNATLENGVKIELEYYGNPTVVESLDDIIPTAVAENEYKYYNSDGNLSLTRELGTSYLDEYNGKLTFYLIPEGDTKYSSDKVVVKVDKSLVNAGEISLADVDQTTVFDIKYTAGGIQLQSYAAGYGYGNMPNNGTLTITKDDAGVYDIQFDVTNSYHNSYTEKGGDNTRIVLHYNGTFEAY